MKILLFGSSGQLGSAWGELSQTDAFPIGWELISIDQAQVDLAAPDAAGAPGLLQTCLSSLAPDGVINAAAYTAVDRAETEGALCRRVNADAPASMAAYCKRAGIPLVHYSTDYVYSGAGQGPHLETEAHAPLNEYGRSKAAGDEAVLASGAEALIFRTSWVFSHAGQNFVKTMRRLAREREELRVVADQVGAPTYAPDLAKLSLQALMRALEQKASGKPFPTGVYHLTNSGYTSWAGFARAILPGKRVLNIATADYPTPARRPLNSRLDLAKFGATFGVVPRPWEQALSECLERLSHLEANHGS